jgi:tetratricopeptide (TPR) repeat protein
MRLIYVVFILLLVLMTSAQCQQTAEDWVNKGDLFLTLGKYNEAIDAYNKAIELNQSNTVAWKQKSNALTIQSKNDVVNNPWILAEAILLLFLFASVPIIWNMHKYYNHVAVIEGILKEKVPAGDNNLVNIFAQCEMTGPSGFQGVGRVTLALTLCMIVGLGVLFLFANPGLKDDTNSQYVKDILLALTGTISSIIGFYFGGRGSAGDFLSQDAKK